MWKVVLFLGYPLSEKYMREMEMGIFSGVGYI